MNKRDVDKLKVGDFVHLKHNLGRGTIEVIAMDEEEYDDAPSLGRYPMIKFRDEVTKSSTWCTYLAILAWIQPTTSKVRRT